MTMVRLQNARRNDPVAMVRDLEEHLNRVFGGAASAEAWTPAVEVFETDEAYVVEADLPGFAKEAFRIEAEDGRLLLSGERKREEAGKAQRVHRAERRFGKFERRFRFPRGFKADAVTAEYVDGVLRVTLPRREEDKPRTIDVKFG